MCEHSSIESLRVPSNDSARCTPYHRTRKWTLVHGVYLVVIVEFSVKIITFLAVKKENKIFVVDYIFPHLFHLNFHGKYGIHEGKILNIIGTTFVM